MNILDEAFGKETKCDRMRSNVRDAWDRFKWWFLEFAPLIVAIAVVTACAAGMVWLVVAMARQEAAWQRFAIEHECKVVVKVSGDVHVSSGPVIGANGKVGVDVVGVAVVTSSSGKTAYQCNDGVTYWR
jgi:hypothetical protein